MKDYFRAKIFEKMDILSKKEKEIAKYLMNEDLIVDNITIKNIIDSTTAGFSTIYSFFKKVGYKNIKELLLDLKENAVENDTFKSLFEMNSDSDEVTIISSQYLKNIKFNTELIGANVIENFNNLLIKYRTINIIGLDNEETIASELTKRLTEIGFCANFINWKSTDIIYKIMSLEKDDMIIFISLYGESDFSVKLAELAKEQKIKSFLITSALESRIINICDEYVKTALQTRNSLDGFEISCVLPAIYFCDIVLYNFFHSNNKKYRDHFVSVNRIIKEKFE